MTILKDRPVWIFREHRSGSTWLAKTIADILGREHIFFDAGDYTKLSVEGQIKYFMDRPVEPADNNRVFSTHTFKALESLESIETLEALESIETLETSDFDIL